MAHKIQKSVKDLPKGIWRTPDGYEIRVVYLDRTSDCYRVENLTFGGYWWEPVDYFKDGTFTAPSFWDRISDDLALFQISSPKEPVVPGSQDARAGGDVRDGAGSSPPAATLGRAID